MSSYLYIETDGKVFLIDKDGTLDLPEDSMELDFEVEVRGIQQLDGKEVKCCKPLLSYHPVEWNEKDDVPILPNASPLSRLAVNRSFARTIVNVCVIHDNKVLMVLGKRGFTKDRWHIPGGFADYGEPPSTCAIRELKEEVGADISIRTLIGVYTRIPPYSPLPFYGFTFTADLLSEDLVPNDEDIADLKWIDAKEGAKILRRMFSSAPILDESDIQTLEGSA